MSDVADGSIIREVCYGNNRKERRGYANGCKPKRVSTLARTIPASVSKTAGHGDGPLSPRSLERGLRGGQCIASDDHADLKAARRAAFGGVKWQRCQFRISQNAIHHAPSAATRRRIGSELRAVWNAPELPAA